MAVAVPSASEPAGRRRRIGRRLPALIALLPAATVVIVVYLGCILWTLLTGLVPLFVRGIAAGAVR